MARFVRELSGPEGTGRFGAPATDLGYPAPTNHGYTITIFGDSFADHVGGADWRSPIGFRQSNQDIENGIVWDNAIGGARAKQMINYRHAGGPDNGRLPDGFTNIPCDLIHLPDGRYVMTTFAIKSWASVTEGSSWETFHSRMWTSTDTHAENWVRSWDLEADHGNFDFPNAGVWRHFQNNTMLLFPSRDEVYIYGTNSGRWHGGGIHLARVDWRRMWERSAYEFLGRDSSGAWGWRRAGHSADPDGRGADPSSPIIEPTVPGSAIGELGSQVIDGQVVLSYLDGPLGAVTRTAPAPEGAWTLPRVQVSWREEPFLYAPTIHPFSRPERAQMLLSAWPHDEKGTEFYGVRQWEVSLLGITNADLAASPALAPAVEGLVGAGSLGDGSVGAGPTGEGSAVEGARGLLAPELGRLPEADRVAALAASADDGVQRDHLEVVLAGG
ncbi:DUF4185 domain-containing protein [Dietzia sp.]|uniref:DUF4185 domain-containing protein n=1 Tax=Dietzia sp. TaxID=1871616 RepID=UPI002FDA91D7